MGRVHHCDDDSGRASHGDWVCGRGKVSVTAVTIFGVVGLAFGVWGGQFLAHYPAIESWFRHDPKWLAWAIMIYGLAASILPVWMLLTPRDYLSTFLKLGTVAALAVAVIVLRPILLMPAIYPVYRWHADLFLPGRYFRLCASRSPAARSPVFIR